MKWRLHLSHFTKRRSTYRSVFCSTSGYRWDRPEGFPRRLGWPITCEEAYRASVGGVSIPVAGDTFSDDRPYAFLSSQTGKHINGSPRHVEIECIFKDPSGGLAFDEWLGLPAKISSAGVNDTEEYIQDFSDPPLLLKNKAGDVFDHLPTRLANGRIITIEKYVRRFDEGTHSGRGALEQCRNSHHDRRFHARGGYALLTNASLIREGGANIWKAEITIIYNPNAWIDKLPDVGFTRSSYDLVTGDPHRQTIVNTTTKRDWIPAAKPAALDDIGTEKTDPGDVDLLSSTRIRSDRGRAFRCHD